jgi:pimeloyl-ACP methyl ester carboxylesterase
LLIAVLGLAILLPIVALLAWWPMGRIPQPPATPPLDYEAARAKVAAALENSPPTARPECRSQVLDHGSRTRDAYVLLHGLTNCPAQFARFADILYARGANVLLLRLPHHGLADRMTTESAKLTAGDLIASASEAVDLARGYGERVTVIGLSVSGVSAAWIAQTRADVDLVVVIAPFLAPAGLPDWAIPPLANLLCRLPNGFIWWDPKQRENLVGSPYSYPRFATRSIGETMRLGLDVFALAKKSPPAARRILLVTSPADRAISMPRVKELAVLWGSHAQSLAFPAEWNAPHDCIDPAQPGAQVERVYPQLLEWIDTTRR